MNIPFTSADDITAQTASCYPLAQIAVTSIHQDVVKFVPADPMQKAEALAVLLHDGTLFQDGILESLHDMVGTLDVEIGCSTRAVEHYDTSPENVSDNTTWQEIQRTRKSDRLSNALAMILELYATITAVHDLLRAVETVKALRAAT